MDAIITEDALRVICPRDEVQVGCGCQCDMLIVSDPLVIRETDILVIIVS